MKLKPARIFAAAVLLVLAQAPSVRGQSAGAPSSDKPPAQSPAQEGASPPSSAATGKVQDSSQPLGLSNDVTPPFPIYEPQPPYTVEARKHRVQGKITLTIVVSAEGEVTAAELASPPLGSGLDESALQTVRSWRFRPATREGKPVSVKVSVDVSFQAFGYGGGHRGPVLDEPIPPKLLFGPEPAYTDQARRARLEGTVTLRISVDKKGRVKKVIEIGPKLGMGLDEQAIKMARAWTFQPATFNGKPIPSRIEFRVSFRL